MSEDNNLLLFSNVKFNVNLDDMWSEWGFTQKKTAVKYLQSKFQDGVDFFFTQGKVKNYNGKKSIYMLTTDCAFEMAKNIQTTKAIEYKNDKLDEVANLTGAQLSALAMSKLLEENQNLVVENGKLIPKAEAFDELMSSHGNMTMKEAANVLNYGRNTLFGILRLRGIFTGRLPYEQYRGEYFEVKTIVKNELNISTTLVTPKGLEWLRKLLKTENKRIEK